MTYKTNQNLTLDILAIQKKILEQDYNLKKELGQFFTSSEIANYMASMVHSLSNLKANDEIKILDAGAGTAILSISAVLQCIRLGYKSINVTLFEIDKLLVDKLNITMKEFQKLLERNKIDFQYAVYNEDFVLFRPDKNLEKYHISIINPPYFKYSVKESKYSKATSDLFKGDPNIYASFMAIVMNSLKENGQMIAIVPRSFTNGLYFKGFRSFIENISSFNTIHIFKSRNKLFKESKVLQENIICKLVKSDSQEDKVKVISTNSIDDIKESDINFYDASFIIDKTDDFNMIHIPENIKNAEIMKRANILKTTFSNEGYKISTGKIVDFRNREYLSDVQLETASVPLYKGHNIQSFNLLWDATSSKNKYFNIVKENEKDTLINGIFVFLRRFSSKDENKRLIAAIYNKKTNERVAIDNKLNYITRDDSLDNIEATGLCLVLNSTFMDEYFRCFSGNTQVNATEIRMMKFPRRQIVKEIGAEWINNHIKYSQHEIDTLVNKYLYKSEKYE